MPLPVPDEVTVHQTWLQYAVQAELEVIVNSPVPGSEVTIRFWGETLNVGGAPACVTVTETAGIPATVTVTVATRGVRSGFAVTEAVMLPLPVPEGVTVHHAMLLATVQAEFEVTENDVFPAV